MVVIIQLLTMAHLLLLFLPETRVQPVHQNPIVHHQFPACGKSKITISDNPTSVPFVRHKDSGNRPRPSGHPFCWLLLHHHSWWHRCFPVKTQEGLLSRVVERKRRRLAKKTLGLQQLILYDSEQMWTMLAISPMVRWFQPTYLMRFSWVLAKIIVLPL